MELGHRLCSKTWTRKAEDISTNNICAKKVFAYSYVLYIVLSGKVCREGFMWQEAVSHMITADQELGHVTVMAGRIQYDDSQMLLSASLW